MVDIIKQDMTNIWAVAGDVVAPDTAKIRGGWGVEAIPRQWWNWFENRQDTNIAYMLQKGIPEWDQFTEYLTNKSYVQRNNVVYKCILTGINKDPATQTDNWVKAFPESSAGLEALKPFVPTANTFPYMNGSNAVAAATLTPFARTILDDATDAEVRATISAQQSNSNLTALSAVTASTNALPYFTGTSAMGTTVLTQAARDVLGGVDYAAIRATLQLTSAAITPLQASATERDISKIMRVGAFGLGNVLDLRTTVYATGVPSDVFGAGTVFGFANGGTTPAPSLNIPGLTGTYFGTLQVNGQSDATGLTAMSRVFITNNGRTFTQAAASASSWGTWVESWTSSNLVKTLSSTDNAAGRMLQVADFGIGQQGVVVGSLNALTNTGTGFYKLGPPYTGSPIANTPVSVIHMAYDNERTQIAVTEGYALGRMFFRKYTGSTSAWGSWVETYNTGNTAQIVADVQAGIQPTLDAKVNRAGDTMTGALTLPSIELGTQSTPGILDFHTTNGHSDFDVRMFADSAVSGQVGGGRLNLSAAQGVIVNGLINAGNGVNVTGNINSSGVIAGAGVTSSAGLTVSSGVTTLQAVNSGAITSTGIISSSSSVRAASGFTELAASQVGIRCVDTANGGNVHVYFYNYNGTERGLIYMDTNAAMHFRSSQQADTLTLYNNRTAQFGGALGVSGRVTCTDVLAAGNVYSGNGGAFMATDGNVYGGVWGGYLSTYLGNNYIQPGNLQNNIVAQGGAGNIGTYALLQHVGGANAGPGVNVAGTELSWATAAGGFDERVNYGTWRIMGRLSTGNKPVATTLFMRIS